MQNANKIVDTLQIEQITMDSSSADFALLGYGSHLLESSIRTIRESVRSVNP